MIRFGMVWALAWSGVALAGPPEVSSEATTQAPRAVKGAADLADAEGVRATVVGTLVRVTPKGIEGATEGTALALGDGAHVFVSQGAPPEAWVWMVGSEVRVQGLLWSAPHAKGGWAVAWLADAEAPMPADGMPGL